MYTLGAFLILFEGMDHLFIVEDPRATSRRRTVIKASSLDNCLYSSMYRVDCCHTHIHSITSFFIFYPEFVSCACVETVELLPVLEMYALIIYKLWRVCSCENILHRCKFKLSFRTIWYFVFLQVKFSMGLPCGCFALSSYLHCLIWLHMFWYARSRNQCSVLHVLCLMYGHL